MREVFFNQDGIKVGYYKSILDEADIPNFIRNQNAQYIVSMPSGLFFPALCVNDEDYERAIELLSAVHDTPVIQGPDWTCPHCHEAVPASFDSCWKCGTIRE